MNKKMMTEEMTKRAKFPDAERAKILREGQLSLWKPEGKIALDYLRNQRHISDDVIKRFQIGYCPREVSHELAGRIIMPCFNVHGDLIAFSTRDFEAPKRFQHWHESFDKSSYLYGLDVAKKAIQWSDKAIVVEGQFDVMGSHTHKLPMTVGLFGTTLSIMHVALLARYCSEIYLVFDPSQRAGDTSGEDATKRAMELYYEYCLSTYGVHFIPVVLPGQYDPDDFLHNNGKDAYIKILDRRRYEVLNG